MCTADVPQEQGWKTLVYNLDIYGRWVVMTVFSVGFFIQQS